MRGTADSFDPRRKASLGEYWWSAMIESVNAIGNGNENERTASEKPLLLTFLLLSSRFRPDGQTRCLGKYV